MFDAFGEPTPADLVNIVGLEDPLRRMGEIIVVNRQALVMCPWTRAPPAMSTGWETAPTSSGTARSCDDVPRNIIQNDQLGAAESAAAFATSIPPPTRL